MTVAARRTANAMAITRRWLAAAAALVVLVGAGEGYRWHRGAGGQGAGDDGDAHRGRQAESRADAVEGNQTMKTDSRVALLACAHRRAVLWAQQFKFNLDHLAAKASDAVDVVARCKACFSSRRSF